MGADTANRREIDNLFDEFLTNAKESTDVKSSSGSVLDEFQKVHGKQNLYMRDITIDEQIKVLQLYENVAENATLSEQLSISTNIAAIILYKLDLPVDKDQAAIMINSYIRGEDVQIFKPLTAEEVRRRFKSLQELNKLVLVPSGLLRAMGEELDNAEGVKGAEGTGESSPNA